MPGPRAGNSWNLRRFVGYPCAWIRTNGCKCRLRLPTTRCIDILNPRSFHACRYPTKPSDTAKKFDPQAHNHVVFVRKNKFYEVPLINPEGHELSEAELEVWVLRVLYFRLIKPNLATCGM
jgi:hypothetical protein